MSCAFKLIGGTVAGLSGFWAVSQLTAMTVSRRSDSSSDPSRSCPSEQERKELFGKLAPTWDATVRWDEFTSGISRWRKQLIRRAEGDVLEVAVGTGRNLEYYDCVKIRSLTCIDFSRKMLEIFLAKTNNFNLDVRLKVGNCSKLDFPDNSFDTVVDTFGICSFEDPISALSEMRRVCKPDGRILLLEHGSSDWPWMQTLLANQVGVHVKKFGCYNHRSIEELIKASGIEIVEQKRKHWGTIYCFVCSPGKTE
jgi:methyltransferase OMS1